MDDYFETSICGVQLCVKGEYDAPDLSVGWYGGFEVHRVWVESDEKKQDIKELLADFFLDQLEHEAMVGCLEAKREAKEDALMDRVRGAGEVI